MTPTTLMPLTYPNGSWQRGAPEDHGLAPAGLAALHEIAAELGSTALLLLHAGVVVSEWYAPNYGPDKVHANLFSVTKSVTSTLVGVAVDKGLLRLDDRASKYLTSWAGTRSEAVTVRNLLANDSGRFWSPESDYDALLYGDDQTRYGLGLEQAEPPGSHWEYNNAAIQTLQGVLEQATGEEVEAFAQRELFEPIGMQATFTRDAAGNALVYQGLSTSAHGIARFAHLIARGGAWKGEQIVSKAWLAEATRPGTALNSAYGYMWWLNREGHVIEPSFPDRVEYDRRLMPAANEQVFAALGAFGQLVIIDPVHDYVVIRLQEVLDLQAALASDPNPVGINKMIAVTAAFEAAKLP